MPTFQVAIQETLVRLVTVEADTPEEARDKVRDDYDNGVYILDADDFERVAICTACDECGEMELPNCLKTLHTESGVVHLCCSCYAMRRAKGETAECVACRRLFSKERFAGQVARTQAAGKSRALNTCPHCVEPFHSGKS